MHREWASAAPPDGMTTSSESSGQKQLAPRSSRAVWRAHGKKAASDQALVKTLPIRHFSYTKLFRLRALDYHCSAGIYVPSRNDR
jgi:hypothetical protein